MSTAIAEAASSPLGSSIPSSSSWTLSVSPAWSPITVSSAAWPRAAEVTVTSSPGLKFSRATRAVSTLVRLAGGNSRWGSRCQRISPVSMSTRIPAAALMGGAPSGIVAGAQKPTLPVATFMSNQGPGVGVAGVVGVVVETAARGVCAGPAGAGVSADPAVAMAAATAIRSSAARRG